MIGQICWRLNIDHRIPVVEAFTEKLIKAGPEACKNYIKELKMFDLLVFIGRFQPFHNEHKRVIDIALKEAKNVLVLIGSCDGPRTPKNPFTYAERSDMILSEYAPGTPLYTNWLYDYPLDDDMWAEQVREKIKYVALDIANNGGFRLHGTDSLRIGIIGAKKDDSSYYLDMFPEFEVALVDLQHMIHATDIRLNYFRSESPKLVAHMLPDSTLSFMAEFPTYYNYLCDWQKAIDCHKDMWKDSPFPVKDVTVDVVVRYRDRVLLVRRRFHPGKLLWALPGGHLEVGERIINGAIRECWEETGLVLNAKDCLEVKVFDQVDRSTLGRVITHAHYFDLSYLPEEPKVVASDDAMDVDWIEMGLIYPGALFDDHFHIIDYFLERHY